MILLFMVSRLLPDNGLQNRLIDNIIETLNQPVQQKTPRLRPPVIDSLPARCDTLK